jgi:hypothetical protein
VVGEIAPLVVEKSQNLYSQEDMDRWISPASEVTIFKKFFSITEGEFRSQIAKSSNLTPGSSKVLNV